MRITGPHDPNIAKTAIPENRQGKPAAATAPETGNTAGAQVPKNAAGRIPDIPPELLSVLDTALTEAGIDQSSLDAAGLYRALILVRHGLPLSRGAVTAELADVQPVLREAAAVLAGARQVLESGALSAQDRTQITALVNDLQGVLTPDTGPETALAFIGNNVADWAADTELKLLAMLATGSAPETAADSLTGAGRLLLSPALLEQLGPEAARLVSDFRSAASELLSQIAGLDPAAADVTEQVQAAMARFTADVASLAGLFEGGALPESAGHLAPALKLLFERQLSLLDEHTLPFVPGRHGSGAAAKTGAMLKRSGLMFEWRLFSWYMAGGSPQRLRQLMQHDLKGVLLSFLGNMRKNKNPAQKGSPVARLAVHARTLVEQIGDQQLSTVASRMDARHPVFFELPLSGSPGSGQAQVKMSEESGADTAADTRELTLSFSVETSVLGEVAATMRIAGAAVSLEFALDHDEWAALGDSQQTDIREQLQKQGFAVGDIVFKRRADPNDRRNPNGGTI